MNRQEADIQDTPPNDPETVVNGEDHELPPIRKAGPITVSLVQNTAKPIWPYCIAA